MESFLKSLSQGGVGVYVAGKFCGCEVPFLGQGQLGKKLGDVVADQVATEQFAMFRIGDQLDEACRLSIPWALPLAVSGNLATRTSWPSSRACCSVRPKEATCGWLKVVRGIIR